mmetsp:Transcript_22170/g.35274  ORF Transcript_22170/g.35274 Transcript_22170/m.35274 type:complete len:95 (+) Transcript_22170:540-824(+)
MRMETWQWTVGDLFPGLSCQLQPLGEDLGLEMKWQRRPPGGDLVRRLSYPSPALDWRLSCHLGKENQRKNQKQVAYPAWLKVQDVRWVDPVILH